MRKTPSSRVKDDPGNRHGDKWQLDGNLSTLLVSRSPLLPKGPPHLESQQRWREDGRPRTKGWMARKRRKPPLNLSVSNVVVRWQLENFSRNPSDKSRVLPYTHRPSRLLASTFIVRGHHSRVYSSTRQSRTFQAKFIRSRIILGPDHFRL